MLHGSDVIAQALKPQFDTDALRARVAKLTAQFPLYAEGTTAPVTDGLA